MRFKDNSLSGILRSLAADEFLAWASYYFYEIISQGKALNYTNKIFEENGKDELEDHYKKLVTWMQSNNIPIPTGLSEMQDICNTQYHALQDPSSTTELVNQMITAEKEAIDAYIQAMKEPAVLEFPDLVIMLGEICNDEREHLKNLEDVKSNIDKYDTRVSNFSKSVDYNKTLYKKLAEDIKYNSEIINSASKIVDNLTKISKLSWKFITKIDNPKNYSDFSKYLSSNKFITIREKDDINEFNSDNYMYYYGDSMLIIEANYGYSRFYYIYVLNGKSIDNKLSELITKNNGIISNFSIRIHKAFEN